MCRNPRVGGRVSFLLFVGFVRHGRVNHARAAAHGVCLLLSHIRLEKAVQHAVDGALQVVGLLVERDG